MFFFRLHVPYCVELKATEIISSISMLTIASLGEVPTHNNNTRQNTHLLHLRKASRRLPNLITISFSICSHYLNVCLPLTESVIYEGKEVDFLNCAKTTVISHASRVLPTVYLPHCLEKEKVS